MFITIFKNGVETLIEVPNSVAPPITLDGVHVRNYISPEFLLNFDLITQFKLKQVFTPLKEVIALKGELTEVEFDEIVTLTRATVNGILTEMEVDFFELELRAFVNANYVFKSPVV